MSFLLLNTYEGADKKAEKQNIFFFFFFFFFFFYFFFQSDVCRPLTVLPRVRSIFSIEKRRLAYLMPISSLTLILLLLSFQV
jgi:hypothetical protein